MPRDLPPLAALRAFEAAARHRHYSDAARELGLTASAVSHQIKRLEENLGAALFERHEGGMRLTAFGRRYLGPVQGTLYELAAVTGALRREVAEGPVLLVAPESFAAAWLASRRAALARDLPLVELQLRSRVGRGERADLEVRLGQGRWDRLCSAELQSLPGGRGYHLVWHRGCRESAAALALREWLLAQGEAVRPPAPAFSETRSPLRPCERTPVPRVTAPLSL